MPTGCGERSPTVSGLASGLDSSMESRQSYEPIRPLVSGFIVQATTILVCIRMHSCLKRKEKIVGTKAAITPLEG